MWFCVCVRACDKSGKGEDSSFENLHEMQLRDWIEWALVNRQNYRQALDFFFDPSVFALLIIFFLWISESTPELSDFEVAI